MQGVHILLLPYGGEGKLPAVTVLPLDLRVLHTIDKKYHPSFILTLVIFVYLCKAFMGVGGALRDVFLTFLHPLSVKEMKLV